MNIMELGAIGEAVGGIAVLATLLYLALQVRQGNKVGSREAHRHWVSEITRVLFEPTRDAEFMELFQHANRDWDSLSPRDQGRVNAVYAPLFLLFQEMFAESEKGDVDEHLIHFHEGAAASVVQMPGAATWWAVNRPFWSPSFVAHLEDLLASEDCPPPLHPVFPWFVGESADGSNASKEV